MKNNRKEGGGRKRSAIVKRQNRLFFLYISPWLIGFLGLTLFPMCYSLYLSFTDSAIGDSGMWIGMKNYLDILSADDKFRSAIRNTVIYVCAFVPLSMIFGISIAMILNQNLKGRGIFRVAFYIPSICAGVAVTLLWGWIFSPEYGLLNYLLSLIGVQGPKWLLDPKWAMFSIVLINLWTQGNTIIIFLAGLQDIPQSLYESASIDGASWWQKTRNITLPLLTPTLYFNMLLGMIGAFQMFNQPFLLTRGTSGESATYTYMMHTYNFAFRYGRTGYACALAWILLLAIFAVTFVVQKSSKGWVHYMDE